MKTFFVSFCLFFCFAAFSQDTMVGKKLMFNRVGSTALKKWNVRPFVFMTNSYGVLFTIVSLREPFDGSVLKRYLLVNDKNDSAEAMTFSITSQVKQGNVFTEDEFYTLLAKYPAEKLAALMAGKLELGMNEEEAQIAFGNPEDIHSTITTTGKTSQWVYAGGAIYLYFENGKLTAIQD